MHDIAIIGAGMVGASIAFHVSRDARGASVLWLEAEAAPGYHSTGRSAALFAPSYGPNQIRALTRCSRGFYEQPPVGFSNVGLLASRGVMLSGGASHVAAVHELARKLDADGSPYRLLTTEQARAHVGVLRPEAAALSLLDETAMDIDVDALLQGFARGAKAAGVDVVCGARVTDLVRQADGGTGHWRIVLQDGPSFDARVIVNAAGAWGDAVAALAGVKPLNLEPRRRSAFIFEAPAGPDGAAARSWPAVIDITEQWYFKPDAGALLGSPANADPVVPHDVVPEAFDIALGIHRIEEATTMTIRRPKSTWAGLRSFVADGEPVVGYDAAQPSFFWAVGLGGYGIKTSPSLGRAAASLLAGKGLPTDLQSAGLDAAKLSPTRPGLASKS
jgi:D-arginine dehydrogenase